MIKVIRTIVLTGLWITASEFLRNEFLVQKIWIDHFSAMGLPFAPNPMVSGPLWMVWSFLLGLIIWKMRIFLRFWPTVAYAWIAAFPMMWIPLFNLQVLPLNTLYAALPLSFLEVFLAVLICSKSMGRPDEAS